MIELEDAAVQKCQPRLMMVSDSLGLVLSWTRSCGSTKVCLVRSIGTYLIFCTQILIHVLQGMEDANIERPSEQKINNFRRVLDIDTLP